MNTAYTFKSSSDCEGDVATVEEKGQTVTLLKF